MFRVANFENILERATSSLLLEPDWNSTLQLCDMIRQKDITPKSAMISIRKRLEHINPHVILLTLQVIESLVKNCGAGLHKEVATKDFMQDLKDLCKMLPEETAIRQKILELIQVWSHAFRNEPSYHVVKDTYVLMKMEGYNFPLLKESDAMFSTENPPDWVDGEHCYNCKAAFSLVQRKHHCRNCGQIFCQKCSAKTSIIPKYGIEREVRVCDTCYEKSNAVGGNVEEKTGGKHSYHKDKDFGYLEDEYSDSEFPTYESHVKPQRNDKSTLDSGGLPPEYVMSPLSKQPQGPAVKTEQELNEEIELALALSASEAESNLEKAASKYLYLGVGPNEKSTTENKAKSSNQTTNQSANNNSTTALIESDMENELARYLDRAFWENKQKQMSLMSSTASNSTAKNNLGSMNNVYTGVPHENLTQPSAPDFQSMTNTNSCPSPTPSIISTAAQNNNNNSLNIKQSTNMHTGSSNTLTNNYSPRSNDNEPSSEDGGCPNPENFARALQNGMDIFIKRMRSNASRNRSIINDSSVQTLFTTLTALQPKLLEQLAQLETKRNHLETLQDKLSQIKDGRGALEALREDFAEKERLEYEARQKAKHQQMAQKLELMRKKKQEYLDYQRMVTLQRLETNTLNHMVSGSTNNMPSGPMPQQLMYDTNSQYAFPGGQNYWNMNQFNGALPNYSVQQHQQPYPNPNIPNIDPGAVQTMNPPTFNQPVNPPIMAPHYSYTGAYPQNAYFTPQQPSTFQQNSLQQNNLLSNSGGFQPQAPYVVQPEKGTNFINNNMNPNSNGQDGMFHGQSNLEHISAPIAKPSHMETGQISADLYNNNSVVQGNTNNISMSTKPEPKTPLINKDIQLISFD